jgi:hypothetical protein
MTPINDFQVLLVQTQLTAAKYFVESPSYMDPCEWEQFLIRSHAAADKTPLPGLSALINALPRALARVEVQFSAVSHAYDIRTFNSSGESHVSYPSVIVVEGRAAF